MFAALNASACGLPEPADWIPELMAAASEVVSFTPVRFTVTVTAPPAPPENPGPEIMNDEDVPPLTRAVTLDMLDAPRSYLPESCVPAATWYPAVKPLSPRPWASTVDLDRSMDTEPLLIAAVPVAPRPPPMNTARLLAKIPPWFKPMDCACRLISLSTF